MCLITLMTNTVIESFLKYFTDRSFIIILQTAVNFVFLFFFFLRMGRRMYRPPFLFFILFFIIYFSYLSSFSSDIVRTMNFLLKFLIPLVYLVVGYNLLTTKEAFVKFIKWSWIFMAYFTLYVLIVNLLGIGASLYRKGLLMGFYDINGLYIPAFAVIAVLFNYRLLPSARNRIVNIIFAIATTIIIILVLKRTLILLLALGLLAYMFINLSLARFFRFLFVGIIVMMIFNSFFSDLFRESYESRQRVFSQEYSVTEEGRFQEGGYIYDLLDESYLTLFFGSGEVFNDRTSLARLNVFAENRESHNSYVRILWSGGFVGLFLFVLFYLSQMTVIFRLYRNLVRESVFLRSILLFGFILVALRFLSDFSSGVTMLTFNAYCYLFIGGIIRLGREEAEEEEEEDTAFDDFHMTDQVTTIR